MINTIRNIPGRSILAVFIILMIIGAGCKSKKKVMEITDTSAEKAKTEHDAAIRKQNEEEARRKEADENARKEAEAREREKASAPTAKLEQYFNAIANAGSISSANSSISETLTLFASEETPVLIKIGRASCRERVYSSV